ncbi:MAG TPA: hypothetical protein VIW29_18910 [Polyangiaceae bacterium]
MNVEARALAPAALIFGLILGCKASVNADANASVDGEGSAKADAQASALGEGEGQGTSEMTRQSVAAHDERKGNTAPGAANFSGVLLGARHDLKLRSGKGTASCSCLSVALGTAHNPGMQWTAEAPTIDETTQLSIALSSEGAACPGEPKGSLGASYWGYRLSGNDVVVLVEAARGGRPLTSGAIIPRPVGSGQVYVAPASRKLPYGRPLEGKGLCQIGNPGQARNAPFSELELGVDAPDPSGDGNPAD